MRVLSLPEMADKDLRFQKFKLAVDAADGFTFKRWA